MIFEIKILLKTKFQQSGTNHSLFVILAFHCPVGVGDNGENLVSNKVDILPKIYRIFDIIRYSDILKKLFLFPKLYHIFIKVFGQKVDENSEKNMYFMNIQKIEFI